MQKPFVTQPALFVTSADLEHLMAGIYARKTGWTRFLLLTLLRASLLGIWYRLSDVELAQTLFRDLLSIDRQGPERVTLSWEEA